jgi:hypothetical protein
VRDTGSSFTTSNILLVLILITSKIKANRNFEYVSYKGSVHLAKQFQRRRFLEIDQSESSIAYGRRVSADQNEMSNPYRGPSIDTSYQIKIISSETA